MGDRGEIIFCLGVKNLTRGPDVTVRLFSNTARNIVDWVCTPVTCERGPYPPTGVFFFIIFYNGLQNFKIKIRIKRIPTVNLPPKFWILRTRLWFCIRVCTRSPGGIPTRRSGARPNVWLQVDARRRPSGPVGTAAAARARSLSLATRFSSAAAARRGPKNVART